MHFDVVQLQAGHVCMHKSSGRRPTVRTLNLPNTVIFSCRLPMREIDSASHDQSVEGSVTSVTRMFFQANVSWTSNRFHVLNSVSVTTVISDVSGFKICFSASRRARLNFFSNFFNAVSCQFVRPQLFHNLDMRTLSLGITTLTTTSSIFFVPGLYAGSFTISESILNQGISWFLWLQILCQSFTLASCISSPPKS